MYLKHLVLQGYKSFARKTEFEFPTGITAIVGPNGTGKSNIADAIRWALGERSMSTLRAKSTSDMIFAGGDGRARAGMAEVALTFDNADRSLPIEYSEVTIARRAYHSGENEYLINGSQVLLREIEELLAESSLSERTYTVIGQGVVDAALALRPQERRALFEEAAGITLYRDRREKTVERLDETERNLERVRDITAEIAPRVKRLERDARQAKQHGRLRAHLERLQSTWYGYRWGQQQGALAQALERAAALRAELEERKREAEDVLQRLSQVRERESALRAELRQRYRQSADLHEEVDKAQRELAVAEERERLLGSRREELLDEIEPLEAQQREQVDRVSDLHREVESLEHQLAERRERLSEVESRAAQLAQQVEEREQKRLAAENRVRGERARLEELSRGLSEAQGEISRLANERVLADERVRQLESRREEVVAGLQPLGREEEQQAQRVADQRTRVGELQQAVAARQRELTELERAWEAFRAQSWESAPDRVRIVDEIRQARAELERLEEARRAASQEEAALAGELKALSRLHDTGAAYDEGVQVVLKAGLEGVLGPLSKLIEVASEWEHAVEAVLGAGLPGGALQAIVVEENSTVEQVMQVLEGGGSRVALISLEAVRDVRGDAFPMGARSARDVVTCEDAIQPVVDALLGSVALCEDLAEARTIWSEMPPWGFCVTRDGAALGPGGVYLIGELGSQGLLAEQRARRKLPERLQVIRERLEALDRRRRKEKERIASLEAELAEIDRQTARAKEEKSQELQRKVGEARTAVAVATESLRAERTALERELSELERIQGRREALRQQVSRLEQEVAAQAQRAEAIRFALETPQVGASREEGDRESTRGLGSAGGVRHRLQQAQRRCESLEQERQAAAQRVESLEERVDRLTRQAADARREEARFEGDVLSEARTAVAVAEASLRNRREALERESRLLERLSSQVDARRERAAELKAERERLLDGMVTLRQTADHLGAELGDVREGIGPAETDLETLSDRQASLEEERHRAERRLRAAEELRGRAELEVERRRDDLQGLAEHIDEDLGLVELELDESVTAQTPLPMRPLVSALPVVEQLPEGLQEEMQFVRKRLRRLGAINPNAPAELAEVGARYDFLRDQADDLQAAIQQLRHTVSDLDAMMERAFKETFEAVADRFSEMFSDLFAGGEARLTLTEPSEPLTTGVDIVARPPGKRAQRLALLSGGERALTAVALLFSLLHVSPTPFCVLDEVDAMLDEANVGRFRTKLEELAQQTQFIVITHNRRTVESAHALYGVSMGGTAVSQVVSLKMGELE